MPTGWPDGVHPPGTDGFEQTAVNWLLDVVPPDYRLHGVLVRHPVALAAMARHHVAACVEGAREGYRCARAELGKDLPPSGLVAVLEAYKTEGQRLVATAKAVDLVGRALRGESFVPQLAGSRNAGPQNAGPQNAGPQNRAPRDGGRSDGGPQDRAPRDGERSDGGPQSRAPGDGGRSDGGPRGAQVRRGGQATRSAAAR
jgi:hypothetical protein